MRKLLSPHYQLVKEPLHLQVIDSDSDEEEVSPKVPRGGFRFPKPTALEVEGGGESSGGAGSDDEVVLGDEDMLPGSPTAPVDLSEAAAAAAAGKRECWGLYKRVSPLKDSLENNSLESKKLSEVGSKSQPFRVPSIFNEKFRERLETGGRERTCGKKVDLQ